MPRKKKQPEEILIETVESTETDSPELNEDPAALSEEIEEEAPAKPRVRKPRKPRAPRKRAEPKVVATEEELAAAATPVVDEATPEPIAELPSAPLFAETAPSALPIGAPTPIPPVAIEAPPMMTNANTILHQWESINAISTGVCNNLERVNTMIRDLPANYSDSMAELLKPPAPKPSPLTKLAAGVSIAAAILSVMSLSLSQSARQAILNPAPVAQAAPIQATRPAPQPIYQAPPVAPVAQAVAPRVAPTIPMPRISAPIAVAQTTPRRHVVAPAPRPKTTTRRAPVRARRVAPSAKRHAR